MVLALGNLVVIEAALSCLTSFVNQKDHAKYLCAELLTLDRVSGDCEDISEHGLRIGTFFNCLLNRVDTATLKSDADDVFEVALAKALVELFVNDVFHARVNLSVHFFMVDELHTLLDINVNALSDESLCVLTVFVDVEVFTSFKGKTQRVICLVEVIKNFRSD